MRREVAQGLIVACVPFGGAVGAFISRFIVNRLSRRYIWVNSRKNILMVNVFALLAGLVIFVPNVHVLFAARILQGICAGFYSTLVPLITK